MGWRKSLVRGVQAIHHGGILPHFRGKMLFAPKQRWSVVVLTNISSFLGSPTSHVMANNIIGMLHGKRPRRSGLSLRYFYWLIWLGLGLLFWNQIKQTWALREWREKARKEWAQEKRRMLGLKVSVQLLFPVIVLVGVPLYFDVSWFVIIQQAPDLGYYMLIVAVLDLGLFIAKAKTLWRNFR